MAQTCRQLCYDLSITRRNRGQSIILVAYIATVGRLHGKYVLETLTLNGAWRQ